jgi:hypothetical protein
LLTGGHHRVFEITQRIQSGRLDPNAIVEVLIHD